MELLEKEINMIAREAPFVKEFFDTYGIHPENENIPLGQYFDTLTEDYFEDIGMDKDQLISNLEGFCNYQLLRRNSKSIQ